MSDFAIIFQIGAGLLVIFFLVLTYFNTKTWRWVHVTFMFFVFAAAFAFLILAGMSFKTRIAWMSLADRLEKDLATVTEQNELLNTGKLLDPSVKSVVSLQAELDRTLTDRGRVWRHVTPQLNADGSLTVMMVPPPPEPVPGVDAPAPAAPAAPQKHSLEAKTVIHAFKEPKPAQGESGPALPKFYLGEYQVTAVTDTSATLVPTMPLAPDQAAQVRLLDSTWALYETAPVDKHFVLEGKSEEELKAMIPQLPGVSPARYNAMIQEYVRDGQQAGPTDPPERVWVKVKFTKSHDVDVDAVQAVDTVDGSPFDNGLALRSRLRRSEPGKPPQPVNFKPGDTAVFNKQKADELISQGIATQEGLIYRRRLHDYEFEFHAHHRRMVALNNRMGDLSRDIATIKDANTKADAQIKLNEAKVAALQADLDKATYERDQLKSYSDKLTGRVAEVQSELSRLYTANRALSRELSEITARLTEEANRRTREATAMVE